jgi:hypothetical protein
MDAQTTLLVAVTILSLVVIVLSLSLALRTMPYLQRPISRLLWLARKDIASVDLWQAVDDNFIILEQRIKEVDKKLDKVLDWINRQ